MLSMRAYPNNTSEYIKYLSIQDIYFNTDDQHYNLLFLIPINILHAWVRHQVVLKDNNYLSVRLAWGMYLKYMTFYKELKLEDKELEFEELEKDFDRWENNKIR